MSAEEYVLVTDRNRPVLIRALELALVELAEELSQRPGGSPLACLRRGEIVDQMYEAHRLIQILRRPS